MKKVYCDICGEEIKPDIYSPYYKLTSCIIVDGCEVELDVCQRCIEKLLEMTGKGGQAK